jgi:membrane-bound serine protease (ClpP class)
MKKFKNIKTRFRRAFLIIWLAALLAPMAVNSSPGGGRNPVVMLEVNGVIGQATMNYVKRGLSYSEKNHAPCLLITIDTPGGLMESMKGIAGAMINAKLPVVVYVYPNGSTATSAGFFILMASDIAAMATDTSTGSAHPVDGGGGQMDDTMKEKVTNYAIKYMEQLTERRGRNKDIGRKAVLRSISVTADEALKNNVIEIIASSVDDLLDKLDGRIIVKGAPRIVEVQIANAGDALLKALRERGLFKDGDEKITVNLEKADAGLIKVLRKSGVVKREVVRFRLETKGAPVEKLPMSFREKFYQLIGHPNIAYILMMLGVYALIFEVTHPGAVAPGIIGVVCLVIAFTAFQVIPINTIGLLMIICAFVLFILELKFVSHGLLSAGGIALMIFGSLMLVDSADPVMRVDIWLILSITGTTAFLIVVALAAVIRTHKRRVTTGEQGMIGLTGKAITHIGPEGKIFVRGEIWNARSENGEPLEEGDRVEIMALEGMTVLVKKMT